MLLGLGLSICAAIAQIGGGFLVLRETRWPELWERRLLALGAGFLLALVVIELIPQSIYLTNNADLSMLVILVGFSALHFFEHTIVEHMHFGQETHIDSAHTSAIRHPVFGAVGGLTIHAFFDGMAISAAAAAKPELGILVFTAVVLHKVPEGLTVASIMLAGKRSTREARQASIALALSTIAGALLVLLFVTLDESLIGFLFAFSAGCSLYVAAVDLIPEINKTKGRQTPLIVLLGMLLFYAGEQIMKFTIGK